MLNKEICKKCIEIFCSKQEDINEEDVKWERGSVFCPVIYSDLKNHKSSTLVNEKPPEKCYYYLEQIITIEDKK